MVLSASRLRRVLALLVLGVTIGAIYALGRLRGLRDLAEDRERTRLQESLESAVGSWEDDLLAGLHERAERAAANTDQLEGLQTSWRSALPWLDAVFVWPLGRPPGSPPQLVFPVPPTRTPFNRESSACLQRHVALELAGAPVDEQTAALVAGCATEGPSIQLFAGVIAAQLLEREQRLGEALEVLDTTGQPDALTLREAGERGVDPFRLAAHRSYRIHLLRRLERIEPALDLAAALGFQVTELEAPEFTAVRVHAERAVQTLREFGRTEAATDLDARLARANRRYDAYMEVLTRTTVEQRPRAEGLGPLRTEDPADVGRIVVDAYSSGPPFLLYHTKIDGIGVAFALDAEALEDDFLASRARTQRNAIFLQDARTDAWVRGATRGGEPALATGVPFSSTLTHVRANVRETVVRRAVTADADQWLLPGVMITIGTLGFGAVAWLIDRNVHHSEELIDRQRAFATRVTHELKTPLAGIRVMAENLEMGAARTEADREEMARRIVTEADQLARKIDQILAFAKARTIPSPVPFDVDELLFELADEWAPRFRDAGIAFSVDPAPTDRVEGDPVAFRDAVACLVDNALKYRRDGVPSSVEVTAGQEGRFVEVRVRDNGLGVPKPMRKRIFDRFVRVEGPNRGKAGGHGLGLHQVREIVEAHKGTVTCQDGVDGGSTFVIRVPAHRPG